jgi:hypothetical protein
MADVNRGGTPVVVIVAIIGLLSTVGASALGGYWASRSADIAAESVQRQFELQRTAHIEDLRRGAYLDFLQSTLALCTASKAEGDAAAIEVLNQQAQARLLASDTELKAAIDELGNAVLSPKTDACANNKTLFGYVNPFVEAADKELD